MLRVIQALLLLACSCLSTPTFAPEGDISQWTDRQPLVLYRFARPPVNQQFSNFAGNDFHLNLPANAEMFWNSRSDTLSIPDNAYDFIAVSDSPGVLLELLVASRAFTIEVVVEPSSNRNIGVVDSPLRIVTFSKSSDRRLFTLGESLESNNLNGVDMRVRQGVFGDASDLDGQLMPSPVQVGPAFIKGEMNHIVVTQDQDTNRIYRNAELMRETPIPIDFDTWTSSFDMEFGIGNEFSSLNRQFSGEIFHIALYDKVLSASDVQQLHDSL